MEGIAAREATRLGGFSWLVLGAFHDDVMAIVDQPVGQRLGGHGDREALKILPEIKKGGGAEVWLGPRGQGGEGPSGRRRHRHETRPLPRPEQGVPLRNAPPALKRQRLHRSDRAASAEASTRRNCHGSHIQAANGMSDLRLLARLGLVTRSLTAPPTLPLVTPTRAEGRQDRAKLVDA